MVLKHIEICKISIIALITNARKLSSTKITSEDKLPIIDAKTINNVDEYVCVSFFVSSKKEILIIKFVKISTSR